jgi:hypothetical protein
MCALKKAQIIIANKILFAGTRVRLAALYFKQFKLHQSAVIFQTKPKEIQLRSEFSWIGHMDPSLPDQTFFHQNLVFHTSRLTFNHQSITTHAIGLGQAISDYNNEMKVLSESSLTAPIVLNNSKFIILTLILCSFVYPDKD